MGKWIIAVALLAAGCASAQAAPPVNRGVAAHEPAANPRPYGAADTAFGLDVLRAWCQAQRQGNLVFSPASLATALGMAYLGARDGTAQAMASVLRLPGSSTTAGKGAGAALDPAADAALLAGLRARTTALGELDGPGVTLAASSQVWADPRVRTLRGYLNALATGYGAGVARVPLQSDPTQAAQQINQAISAATSGQIPQVVSPGMLQGIGWVLTSALYMDADWATPFEQNETGQQQFTTAAGQSVTAKFMHGGSFDVATADGWTGVSLPYRGGKLTMVALLPPSGTAGNCAVPTATAVTAITGHGVLGSVALPKVSLSSDGSMNELLDRLGMSVAFGGSADFSGLSAQACCIGFVQQAATLQVGEKGTVGSAATAVGIVASSARAQKGRQIVFDRPYLLLVTSTASGEPLFLARVANPVTG